ncbi:uncharacterized protein H6S33_006784 [Morchella sextelata]|uniref:uncharacterized protein n=1 Tax=Morchella sextelata TaxID=1174677 RepID=UPI001D04EAE2|nr:uncharacterized protein H6S33_006784 [Morchella sextelata]KAH0604407.1 hypothetical protein H6S33_006784 [Morchella sextelata]
MPIPAFNRTTAVSQWTSFNITQAQVKGIPNFFSRSMFGNTTELKSAAQFIVVWAVVAVILRIFSRRRLKTRIGWDDICAMAAVFFLVTNQMIFSMIEFLGKSSFAFVGRADMVEEMKRLSKIVIGLKLSLAYEVMYLIKQCTKRTLLTFTSGISNIVTNTLVLAVPVPLLVRANLTLRQRIGVSVLYFFGAFVIVASALRFTTQLLDVSVPQAIGWSQIEVSLAIILACAPMCVKLLITPLIDPREFEKATDTTQFVETPTSLTGRMISEKSQHVYYENQLRKSSNMRPHQQQHTSRLAPFIMSGKRPSNDGKVASLFSRFTGKVPIMGRLNIGGSAQVESPGNINTREYQRLKIVRAEVNGQSIWRVRPISPASPSKVAQQAEKWPL